MRIANPNPVACSVCLQPPSVHEPQRRHVDFEVAHEGPVVTRHGESVSAENTVPIPIDDLVICEDCLRAASSLLGWGDTAEIEQRTRALEATITELKEEATGKDRQIVNLTKTADFLVEHPIKKPAVKPVMQTGDEKTTKDLRSARSKWERERRAKQRKKGKAAA